MIVINRDKAEALVIDRLRTERAPRLAQLDVDFMRALERGESTDSIARAKQELRDVTGKDLSGLRIEALAALIINDALALP